MLIIYFINDNASNIIDYGDTLMSEFEIHDIVGKLNEEFNN